MSLSKEVTVIICTKNAEKTIGETIKSILENNPSEIIVVDGKSTDSTIEICNQYNLKILYDDGIGLGNARNIGLKEVKTEYVYYVGPDCILKTNSLEPLIINLKQNNWVGTQPLVSIFEPNNYYLKSINIYRRAKFYPGERSIIGTPWLYKTSVLKEYMFNETMNYSDDTELCARLQRDSLRIGITDIMSYEVGEDNIVDIFKRWKMYGISDYDFYKLNYKVWSLSRKIKSFFSPITKDFLVILKSKRINLFEKFYIFYFLILIILCRYYGWYFSKIKLKK